jgi:hypothetical protein
MEIENDVSRQRRRTVAVRASVVRRAKQLLIDGTERKEAEEMMNLRRKKGKAAATENSR